MGEPQEATKAYLADKLITKIDIEKNEGADLKSIKEAEQRVKEEEAREKNILRELKKKKKEEEKLLKRKEKIRRKEDRVRLRAIKAKRKIELKTNILKSKDPYEIEKILRNKLNFLKEGEIAVIIPNPTPTPKQKKPPAKPVYQQWLEALF